MAFEVVGVTVEDSADVIFGSTPRIGHRTRGYDEVAHIRVLRTQLQRVLVGDHGSVVLAQAGERMTFHSEGAGIGHPDGTGSFSDRHRLAKNPAAECQAG